MGVKKVIGTAQSRLTEEVECGTLVFEYWELCQSISLKFQSQSMAILIIVTTMV